MDRRRAMAGAILALAHGLAPRPARAATPSVSARRIAHPDGWSIRVPAGFAARLRGPAIELRETGALRAPRMLWVQTLKGPAADARGEDRRGTGLGEARYRIEDMGAGSGGTEWRLTIRVQSARRLFEIKAVEQAEGRAPDFDWAWAAVGTLRDA